MAAVAMVDLLQRQLAGRAGAAGGPQAGADPQTALLAKVLEQREQQIQQDLERAEQAEAVGEEELRRRDDRQERVDALRGHLDELTAELQDLRASVDDLASALGACPSCWGADRRCRWCRGRGGPGFMAPDPDDFERLIMPAVRVRARFSRRSRNGERVDDPVAASTGPEQIRDGSRS